MILKKKKSSADKAFELCVDLLGEIRKQGKAIDALAEEIKAKLDGISSAQTTLYACGKETQDNVCEIGRTVTELKNGVMAYEQKKEDAVTAAQILDEYLNGGKEEQ